ncbi:metallophosphoesterase [Urechidicola sp. KH5]
MSKLLYVIIVVFCVISCQKKEESVEFSFGIIADCQYCDCDIKWDRYFRKSPQRLSDAVNELNQHDLDFTIHLGDFIDKDFKSFDSILPTWKNLNSDRYHVLGNHDFDVADSLKSKIPYKLKLKNRYYSFNKHNWKFIVLDGTDLSTYAPSKNNQQASQQLLAKKEKNSLPYAMFYNGALSKEQMSWVKIQLEEAKSQNQNVGFFCHFPVQPIDNHNLWNTEEFLELIAPYENIKFYMNGHNHAGAYATLNNVHHVTFKGMVDTKDTTAFAIATITNDSLFISGFGREPNKSLKLK